MVRFLKWAVLMPLLFVGLALTSCDDEDIIKAAAAKGILLQKKMVEIPPGSGKLIEQYVVFQDPTKDKVDNAIKTAQDYGGSIPIVGQVLGGLLFLSSVAGNLLQKKLQAIADKKNAELAYANQKHEDTHAATALAMQQFVDTHPPEIGKALITQLETVHDHMEVPAEHQETLIPDPKPA